MVQCAWKSYHVYKNTWFNVLEKATMYRNTWFNVLNLRIRIFSLDERFASLFERKIIKLLFSKELVTTFTGIQWCDNERNNYDWWFYYLVLGIRKCEWEQNNGNLKWTCNKGERNVLGSRKLFNYLIISLLLEKARERDCHSPWG